MGKITILPLEFQQGAIHFFVNPVVLEDEKGLTLVDCGFPGFLHKIEEAFKEAGLDINQLRQVIITHHDHDHMGALKELITAYPEIKVYASKEQIPYIVGNKISLRLQQAKKRLELMSEEQREEQLGFIQMIESVPKIEKVLQLDDGDILKVCGGVQVIKTNGHMPGHISLYVKEKKTLISGDALVVNNGVLQIADSYFVLDPEQELDSLKRIVGLRIEEIICYHGGRYLSNHMEDEIQRIIEKGYK